VSAPRARAAARTARPGKAGQGRGEIVNRQKRQKSRVHDQQYRLEIACDLDDLAAVLAARRFRGSWVVRRGFWAASRARRRFARCAAPRARSANLIGARLASLVASATTSATSSTPTRRSASAVRRRKPRSKSSRLERDAMR
jgi:hypothetical protein